jgi:hypothetical protein
MKPSFFEPHAGAKAATIITRQMIGTVGSYKSAGGGI